jgi:hypothetical protein
VHIATNSCNSGEFLQFRRIPVVFQTSHVNVVVFLEFSPGRVNGGLASGGCKGAAVAGGGEEEVY